MTKKRLGAALLLLGLLGGSSRAEDLVVGMSAAFKGPSKGLGIELYRGSMAYFSHLNSQGGVNGRRILVKAYDDGYEPDPAVKNTVRLVEKDGVFLLFDYVGTPTVTRVLPLLKKYGARNIFLFFPFTGAQPHREPPYGESVFNLRASYRQETKGLVDHFIHIGRTNIGVFYQSDAYGVSGLDGTKRALSVYGRKVAAAASYQRGTQYAGSMKAQVEVLRKANPDAVISIGAYAACAAFIRDARDSGWDVPIANVSFVGSDSMLALLLESEKATGRTYTKNLVNSQVVPSYEDTSLPTVRQYRELMDKYDPMPPPDLMEAGYKPLKYSFVSLEGFMNAKLLVEILRRMKSMTDRASLKEAAEGIRKLDLGIAAPATFGPDRHQGLDTVYFTTVRNGLFVPVSEWKEWAKK